MTTLQLLLLLLCTRMLYQSVLIIRHSSKEMMEKIMHYQPRSILWKAFNDVRCVKGDKLLDRKIPRLLQFPGKITLRSENNNIANTTSLPKSYRFSPCSVWSVDKFAWDRHKKGCTIDDPEFSLSLRHEPFLLLVRQRRHSLGCDCPLLLIFNLEIYVHYPLKLDFE